MQLNPLTVQDPLTDKTVIINIQVNGMGHESRDQRPVLVTAGISGEIPIMLSGHYGQLKQLIDQAWQQFGQNPPMGTNGDKGATIASVAVKPTKKTDQSKSNKESILSLF